MGCLPLLLLRQGPWPYNGLLVYYRPALPHEHFEGRQRVPELIRYNIWLHTKKNGGIFRRSFLYILKYMQELEQLKLIIKKFPYNFIKVLNSKKNVHLISYIRNNTQLLIDSLDFKYSLKTRLFWVTNQITSWDDDRVKCEVCGKPFINLNVKKLSIGYKQTCCKRCERILAQDSCLQNLKSKYGVCNSF